MSKHIALCGPTAIGKTTTLYLELVKEWGKHGVLLVRSLEDLKEYSKSNTEHIIFDDISFELSRPELLIHLSDPLFHSNVRILRDSVRIEATTIKWYTHNNSTAWSPILASPEQQAAIQRRIKVVQVSSREQVLAAVQSAIPTFMRRIPTLQDLLSSDQEEGE